ncbi:MAG: hypothetical protein MSG78_01905 [Clostridiales bacterium]|nr:hypothetical protein [Clostridiales bacterium]
MKKIELAGKIMIPILVIVLAVLLIGNEKEETKKQHALAEQAAYVNGLKKNISKTQKEIQTLKEDREKSINKKVSITLCVEQTDASLYEQVKPVFDSYGMQGMFVIKNGALPGSKNVITREQYDEMIEQGWEAAIGTWDDLNLEREKDREVWTERLDTLIAEMNEQKIAVPNRYYFKRGSYSEECKEELQKRGFSLICHYEQVASFYGIEWNKNWNPIGVYQISQENYDIEEIMKQLQEHKASVLFGTRNVGISGSNSLDCSISSYRTVLQSLQEMQEEGSVEVVSASKLYETRLKTYTNANKEDDSYQKELQEKKDKLKELQEEWEAVFNNDSVEKNKEENFSEETTDVDSKEKETTKKDTDSKEKETTEKATDSKEKETTKKATDSKEKETTTDDIKDTDNKETTKEKVNANFSAEE